LQSGSQEVTPTGQKLQKILTLSIERLMVQERNRLLRLLVLVPMPQRFGLRVLL
jgi:hypothetical protein